MIMGKKLQLQNHLLDAQIEIAFYYSNEVASLNVFI